VRSDELSDEEVLRAVASSGARALVIGRRALILLGAPVLTADYDLWIHIDDIEQLNAAFQSLDHVPNRSPAEARAAGRYVLENGERVDVMIARAKAEPEGTRLDFETAWSRRQSFDIASGVTIHLPSLEDLITTKRWGSRPRDLTDIEFLELLRQRRTS
jgi:hypothetical protein